MTYKSSIMRPVHYILFCALAFSMPLIAQEEVKKEDESEKVGFEKVDLDCYIEELKNDMDINEEMDHEVKIFHNALGFSEVIARDCMVPRNEIVAFEIKDDINELKSKFIMINKNSNIFVTLLFTYCIIFLNHSIIGSYETWLIS